MRTTLKHSLATVAALAALALSGTACTAGDDPLGNPAATQLLALGRVTIAGAQTAPADTRALSQDPAGFIGIRKTAFVEGDVLTLTLSNSGTANATLGNDGAWTLDTRTYYAAGITLSATHAATPAAGTPAAGLTHKDVLTTDPAAPVELQADGKPLALTLVHANALLEVTPPVVDIAGTYTISVNTTPGSGSTTPEDLATIREEDAPSVIRYRTIALPGTVHSVTLTANGVAYTAPLNTPNGVKIDANKRYPIALTLVKDVLTATIATTGMDWGTGDTGTGNPAGYTRYIGTAEELAQFAKDVNNDVDGTGARSAIVMQTADIDLNGISWTPIATQSQPFTGKYNGNGFSISNLKITQSNKGYLGLFGTIKGSHLTGIHLKKCNITSTENAARAGALAGQVENGSIITLCSATGSVSLTGTNPFAGGMIGFATGITAEKCYITRCTAQVDVTLNSTSSGYCGGFAACSSKADYASCIASGTVTEAGSAIADTQYKRKSGGFGSAYNRSNDYNAYFCIVTGKPTFLDDVTHTFGNVTGIYACLATVAYQYFGEVTTLQDCVSLTATGTLPGVSLNVAPGDAYGKLTAGNVTTAGTIKTLHWSKETGYTLDLVEATWNTKNAWIDIPGDLPILDMAYEGEPKP